MGTDLKKNNIFGIDKMERIANELRAKGGRIVTTSGSFDILHKAHVNLLKKAKSFGDFLVVFVNSDESVRASKGINRPIISEKERAFLISELKPVDYVVISPKGELLNYIEKIKSHVHIKGGSVDPLKLKREVEFVSRWGCEHKVLDLEEGLSTTKIIDKIVRSYVVCNPGTYVLV